MRYIAINDHSSMMPASWIIDKPAIIDMPTTKAPTRNQADLPSPIGFQAKNIAKGPVKKTTNSSNKGTCTAISKSSDTTVVRNTNPQTENCQRFTQSSLMRPSVSLFMQLDQSFHISPHWLESRVAVRFESQLTQHL
jgi:hypothetical protein